jgi:hypothetical protein
MQIPPDDALLLDMIESVVLDVLTRIGDDPGARFAFFRRLVVLAKDTVREAEAGRAAGTH